MYLTQNDVIVIQSESVISVGLFQEINDFLLFLLVLVLSWMVLDLCRVLYEWHRGNVPIEF